MKQQVIKYRIKEKSWLAGLAAKKLGAGHVAMVIGRTIHLHNVSKDEFKSVPRWLRHEQCHLRQFKEHGFFTFLGKYLIESLKHGYYNNKYEVEAREYENS